jgi:hypothetical protein
MGTLFRPRPGPAGPQGPQGAQGPAGPASVRWQGPWNDVSTYLVGDMVEFNGSAYVAVQSTSASPFDEPSSWELVSEGRLNCFHELQDQEFIEEPDLRFHNGFYLVLGDNRLIPNPVHPQPLMRLLFVFKQDSFGNRTVTWDTEYVFPTPPVFTATPNKSDYFAFIRDPSNTVWNCVAVRNNL